LVNEQVRKRLPPYISYRTFLNFLEGLREGIPSRIDRSYWGDKFSGSTGTQLVSALRFLRLIDNNNTPTNLLRQLASNNEDQRTHTLQLICNDAYVFLLGSTFDPEKATYAQLNEVFHDMYQVTEDVARKCIKFFIQMAQNAEIPLSPFILKRSRKMRTSNVGKRSAKNANVRANRNEVVPANARRITVKTSWEEMLLMKFPSFDPNWPDEVKLKWFDGFEELLKRKLKDTSGDQIAQK
jgi:hypothetical protein